MNDSAEDKLMNGQKAARNATSNTKGPRNNTNALNNTQLHYIPHPEHIAASIMCVVQSTEPHCNAKQLKMISVKNTLITALILKKKIALCFRDQSPSLTKNNAALR